MARVPIRLRTPATPPPADWHRRLAGAAAYAAGVDPDRLAHIDGTASPLDPGATLGALRRCVRPLGLDAVEVSLSPDALAAPAWPVVALRRADVSPVAIATGGLGRVRWHDPAAGGLTPAGRPDDLEAVGYAFFPLPGASWHVPGRWRLRGAAAVLGAAAGLATHAPAPAAAVGLSVAALAGAGLLDGTVRALEDRQRRSDGGPICERPSDGGVWLPDRITDPASGLRLSVWAAAMAGLAVGLRVGVDAGLVPALWAVPALLLALAVGPPRRARAEVRWSVGDLLGATDDLRLAGATERVWAGWHVQHREAIAASGARHMRRATRSAACAALVTGVVLTQAGSALAAALAALAAGWCAGLWLRLRSDLTTAPPAPDLPHAAATLHLSGVETDRLAVPDLTVPAGALVVLTGPPGAGKTRLVRLILGLDAPRLGTVRVCGRTVTVATAPGLRDRLAVLPEHVLLPGGDVAGAVLGAGFETAAARAAWPALDAVGMGSTVRALPMRLMALVAAGGVGFSGGQRRRLAAARVLASGRPLRVLDEPLAGLDPDARAAVWSALRERGVTTLVATRDAALAADADRWYAIEDETVVLKRPVA